MVTVPGATSGHIRFEANVADITPTGIFSPVLEVLGMPWKLQAKKKGPFLAVYIFHRESDSSLWSVDLTAKCVIVNCDATKNKSFEYTKTFDRSVVSWGESEMCGWDELIDKEKGFINDGKIIIEADISLSKLYGIRIPSSIDFTDPNEPINDAQLVIKGENIYVSKQILSANSVVFKAMFYGDFAERNKNEIELKDVDDKEFIEMLHVIYPSNKKITDANFEYLLKLADRFQITTIIDRAEQFLIDSTTMSIVLKLNLSDQFRLVKLQEHCLESLKTVKDIMDLKEFANDLTTNVQAALLRRAFKLS